MDLEQLLDLGTEELIQLLPARARRRIGRGLKRKPLALIKKLREAKKNAAAGEGQGPASHGLAAVMQRSSSCHTLCTRCALADNCTTGERSSLAAADFHRWHASRPAPCCGHSHSL